MSIYSCHSSPRTLRGAVALLLPLTLLIGACEQKPAAHETAKPATTGSVYVTFYPLQYWAERIAGEHVDVVNPCPADADPAHWTPSDAVLEEYQTKADLIIINGASFEHWLGHVSLPEDRIVDTAAAFKDEFIELKDGVTHSHGPGGEHTHVGIDGHTWLNPQNAIRQAQAIEQALAERYQEHAEAFAVNFKALEADLSALDKRLKAVSEKLTDETLLANHPAWNYLARRYGWNLKTYHLDPEEMPDVAAFTKLTMELAQKPARFILWESEPMAEIADRFGKELGLTSIVFSPCESIDAEQVEAGEDFLTMMNANVDRLEQTVQ